MSELEKGKVPENIKYFDKNQLLEILSYDIDRIKYASLELKKDQDVGRLVLKEAPRLIGQLSDCLRDNADFLLDNLIGLEVDFPKISKRLRDNKDFVLKMIPINPFFYTFISTRLKKDKEIYLITPLNFLEGAPLDLRLDYDLNLKKVTDEKSMYWLDGKLLSNKKFILEALDAGVALYPWSLKDLGPKIEFDKEIHIKLLNNGSSFFDVPRILRTDLEILELAIKQESHFFPTNKLPLGSFDKEAIPILKRLNEPYLPYLKRSLKNDKNIVLESIQDNAENLWYSYDFRLDSDCIDLALRNNNSSTYGYARWWNTRKLNGILKRDIDSEKALNFIKLDKRIIYELPKRLLSDKEFILKASSICGLPLLECINQSLRSDKEIIMTCIKASRLVGCDWNMYGEDLYGLIPLDLRDNEILLELVFIQPSFIKELPYYYRDNKPFIKKLLLDGSTLNNFFSLLSDRLRDDEEIVSILSSPSNLKYWSDRLKNNKKLVLRALQNSSRSGNRVAFMFISTELKDDLRFMKQAVQIRASNFEFGSRRLRDNKPLLLLALEKKPHALKYASNRLKNDKEVVLKAFNKIPSSLKHASKELRCNKKFLNEITDDPLEIFHLCHFTIRRHPDIYIPAIKEYGGCCSRFSPNIILNLDHSRFTRKAQLEIYDTFEYKNKNKDIFFLANAKRKILKEPNHISLIEQNLVSPQLN